MTNTTTTPTPQIPQPEKPLAYFEWVQGVDLSPRPQLVYLKLQPKNTYERDNNPVIRSTPIYNPAHLDLPIDQLIYKYPLGETTPAILLEEVQTKPEPPEFIFER